MIQSRQTPGIESYYIGLLYLAAANCRDPDVQHSALIADTNNIPLTPIVCNYLVKPYFSYQKDWSKRELQMMTAEEAVIDHVSKLNGNIYFSGCKLYCSGKPSFVAVRRCSQVGLKNIFYGKLNSEQPNKEEWAKTKDLATEYEITMKPYVGNVNWIRDKIQSFDDLF